jgi:glycosyltransferase involved in cell wall biosynthesis
MRDVLAVRDAFADFAHVESEEVYAGAGAGASPFLTIAIPTYRRADLLAEAVRSALAQQLGRPIEVVVVDDDPQSTGHEGLLEDVPEIAGANFRYLRNRGNLGDAGNHSRCVEAARGEWLSILHDDDLLDPDFAREMFALLAADPRIDGLVCKKRYLDRRDVPYREGRARKLVRKAVEFATFGGKATRPIGARKLFWACVPGNFAGFVCRTSAALSLGGLYTEDFPAADYYFFARFAQKYRLHQARRTLATIGIAVNLSTAREVNLLALRHAYALQRTYAGSALPSWWRRLSPLLLARQITITSRHWHNPIDPGEVGRELGIRISRDRPALVYLLRAVLGGA